VATWGEGVGGNLSRESQCPVRDEHRTKTRRLFMNGRSEGNVDWVFKQRIISHSRRRGTFSARIISFSYQTTNKERSRFVRPDDTAAGEQVGAFSSKLQYVTTASSPCHVN